MFVIMMINAMHGLSERRVDEPLHTSQVFFFLLRSSYIRVGWGGGSSLF